MDLYDTFHTRFHTIPPDGQGLDPRIAIWLESKALTAEDLTNFDVRWGMEKGQLVLAYLFPDGIKYRTPTNPAERWMTKGNSWVHPRVVRRTDPIGVIVAEGETDTMQLAKVYTQWDIACVPVGATSISDELIDELKGYQHILVALDDDKAGNEGAKRIINALPRTAKRMRPDGNDWCEMASDGVQFDPDPMAYVAQSKAPVYSIGEILETDFGSFEDNNWFSDGILPVGGQLVFHAPLKSLKSVVQFDLCRALATGTAFAGTDGYQFVHPGGPAKVLLIQMEVRPHDFQERVIAFMRRMPDEDEKQALRDNLYVYKIADGELPRLQINQEDFRAKILQALAECGAQVVAFDPLQRLTGSADIDKVNELDALLDFFAELQNDGVTIVSSHHNNKAAGPAGSKHPNSMSGSQRFGADPDAICSLTHDAKLMVADDTSTGIKQRNLSWTLRSGSTVGRSITVRPDPEIEHLMDISFGPMFKAHEDEPEPNPDAPTF